ncbi:sugar phosphate permease [Chthonomonas calidirosea]|uniref:Sugar phosphate permease n=1 Tax=Chthonomonas calidirosea (strain DSM 23976 / ICMP 18418 / T49) TaxID=1303518 RepID=S0EW41_CHTCT|nr:MFS transporter [Chthonomonas calidirosea]CCW36078.1 Sugar phosphate permease [Chthonomonas calidirosea T49]CEK17353.1 sugar phosphate permease [Chthonomonas calidirosea]CEK18399.1 sugar phosphate permease [Chthonomonas calidirosea]
MPFFLRMRLILMMFWEYAAWGAWMPIISDTLEHRGISATSTGAIFGAFWLGCVITPFIGGQIADRFMPSQIFLGIAHILAAIAAFTMAHQHSVIGLYASMLAWSLVFAPTLGITNSITLHHVSRYVENEKIREREFSIIRTAGTIGWIVAAFLYLAYTRLTHYQAENLNTPIAEMMLTGILNLVMAVTCFFILPNTPPVKEKKVDPLAFREAFRLFREVPGFTIFIIISFFAATEFMFFYNLSAPFLDSLHIPRNLIPITKSISQATEVIALGVLLPLWLPKFGMRWCLLIGSFAWPLRYFIFALQKPLWLVVASLGLHGFGYAFVMVVQQLYIDRVAPRDIRASAQNMINFFTLGVGNVIGSYFSGWVQQHFTVNGQTDWPPVFILPAITTLICAVAYMFTFRDEDVERIAALREEQAVAV